MLPLLRFAVAPVVGGQWPVISRSNTNRKTNDKGKALSPGPVEKAANANGALAGARRTFIISDRARV
jgi:hypothetical protein